MPLVVQPGHIVATPGAIEAVTPERMSRCLRRHLSGDWGCVDTHDKAINDMAVAHRTRVLSAYPIDPKQPSRGHGANTLWIITDRGWETTTLLLPSLTPFPTPFIL